MDFLRRHVLVNETLYVYIKTKLGTSLNPTCLGVCPHDYFPTPSVPRSRLSQEEIVKDWGPRQSRIPMVRTLR